MFNRSFADKKLQESLLGDGFREQIVPAFAPISERNTQTKTHASTFLSIKPAGRLIDQWKKSDYVYLVRDGLVKLLYTSDNGSQVTLGLRSAGWYGGAASAILDLPNLYSAIAVSDCMVTQIPADHFFEWTTRNVKKLHQVMKSLCLDSIMQAKIHAEISSNTAAERLEHFMQERTTTDPQWTTIDPFPLLKQGELAQLLSVSPEHLCRLRAQRMTER